MSRSFELKNLVPSVSTQAWRVQAEMQFGDGYRFQYFQTPALGVGLNDGVAVTAGATTDLGDTFVMNPARLVGQITLTGPPEPGGNLSALRGLVRAADYDPDTNGIPDAVGAGGTRGSYVNVTGVDELAPGSTLATTSGSAAASFVGAFNPATAAFEGDYEVVLGMLDDQPGIWREDSLSYTFYQLATNGAPYVDQIGNVAEDMPWQGTLAPGERATNDLRYGFAQVCLRIKSPIQFYSPRINASGRLIGLDSEGHARSYHVGSDYAYGLPDTVATAANEGLVTAYLPEGTYTLSASITTIDPGGGESATQLPAIEVTVVAGEKLCLEDCIQVFIEPPMCTTNFGFLARANATSCDGTLTNLSLRASPLSDPSIRLGYSDIRILIGSRTNLTTAHGLFPEFDGFPKSYYENILYTATTLDNKGRVATRQIIAHYDFTAPDLNCRDIIVTATNGSDAVVDFTVTTSSDAILSCNPSSGSVFPLGTNLVSCTARDLCRNTNTCAFRVIVLAPTNNCLQVQLSAPTCAAAWPTQFNGSVQSCGGNVVDVTYELNGKAPLTVCSNCGPNPNFSFTVAGTTNYPLTINSPIAIAGQYQNTATVFWAPIGASVTGEVIYVGQGCPGEPYLVPEASVAGKIVLIDRGGCSVSLKVDRAARLGASAVLLGLVAAGDASGFSYGGGDTFVPTLVITKAAADLIRANASAPVTVTLAEGDSTLTVTAHDSQGGVATTQLVAHYDFVPPIITCPGDITVIATNGSDARVDYTVTATDNRPEPITIACNPPSGSAFPVGTNTITCSASDLCGNTNTCTFNVIVRPLPNDCVLNLTLMQAAPRMITLTWGCGGTLQAAPAPSGPWSDLAGETSPYTAAASDSQRFFRIRIL